MAQMLLINPRKRRTAAKKRPAAKRAKRKTTARRVGYSPNPLPVSKVKRRVRRAAVAAKRSVRRRRNPISMGSLNMRSISAMFKDALIGGAGAVSVDVLMTQVNKFLPASLQATSTPGANQAIKAGLTAVLGVALSKTTKGLSQKAAAGALAVQMADLVRYALNKYAPGTVPAVAGVGYASPAYIVPGSSRISPAIGMSRRGSSTLSAFQTGSPVLSGARDRENSIR